MSEWPASKLDDLFMEAAETERKLPSPFRKQKMASWPQYKLTWPAYGWDKDAPVKLISPTTREVTRHDVALGFALLTTVEDRRLIWAVAHSAAFRERGPKWTKISKMIGRSVHITKQEYISALVRLSLIIADRMPEWARIGFERANQHNDSLH